MNIDTAAKTLNVHTDIKTAQIEELICNDYRKSKTWSNSPTSAHVTSFAEGLIKSVYDRRHLYKAVRVGERTFEVHYIGDPNKVGSQQDLLLEHEKEDQFRDVPLPLFERVRTVTIDEDGTMYCECCKFEATGLFCEQQVATADCICDALEESPFEGFTEKDVAVRWLSAFLHLAYKDSTPAHIQTMLHHLAIHDIAGPKFKKDIPASLPIQSPSPKLSALDRLKNYSRDGIDLEKIDGMFCSTFTPSSMNGGQAELDEIFQQMFDEMQNVHTPATDILFENAISNSALPEVASVGARAALRPLMETTFVLADKVGPDGMKKVEDTFKELNAWFNERLRGDSGKRQAPPEDPRYVAMTQESYDGTAKRICNTYRMP